MIIKPDYDEELPTLCLHSVCSAESQPPVTQEVLCLLGCWLICWGVCVSAFPGINLSLYQLLTRLVGENMRMEHKKENLFSWCRENCMWKGNCGSNPLSESEQGLEDCFTLLRVVKVLICIFPLCLKTND